MFIGILFQVQKSCIGPFRTGVHVTLFIDLILEALMLNDLNYLFASIIVVRSCDISYPWIASLPTVLGRPEVALTKGLKSVWEYLYISMSINYIPPSYLMSGLGSPVGVSF